jgi:hypothetical protein
MSKMLKILSLNIVFLIDFLTIKIKIENLLCWSHRLYDNVSNAVYI